MMEIQLMQFTIKLTSAISWQHCLDSLNHWTDHVTDSFDEHSEIYDAVCSCQGVRTDPNGQTNDQA